MKILFFLDHIGGGGRERRMAQLVLALDRVSSLQMMTITATDKIDYTEVLNTKMKIKVVNDASHRVRIKIYEDVIRNFRPDIIHLWTETSLYCVVLPLLAKKYGCKFVAGFIADGRPMSVHPFIQRQCIRLAFRCSDAIVSNSKAGLLAKKAPLKKSFVIYNGFDKQRLIAVDVKQKREELGVTKSKLVVMCARVNDMKDWQMYISLAEKNNSSDVYFLAIGGGELLEKYRETVARKRLTNIKFVGRRSDVMEILAATDMSVLFTNANSHAEGVSNSIMESMAAGIPVVATAGGGTAEIISNGNNGFIVEPGNIEEANRCLQILLENKVLYHQFSESARKTISSRFDLTTMGDEYLKLYEHLLS